MFGSRYLFGTLIWLRLLQNLLPLLPVIDIRLQLFCINDFDPICAFHHRLVVRVLKGPLHKVSISLPTESFLAFRSCHEDLWLSSSNLSTFW